MTHNENSRVKIPVILHLMRLGFEYLSLKEQFWDKDTNIFPQIFVDSLCRINQGLSADDAKRQLVEITLELDNEDLGQAFYHRLINQSGIKLIDFNNFDNNRFHVVSELPCIHGDDEFRPDITLLINGMPLIFIEVKKPNNKGGIGEEKKRMQDRSLNPKFRRFINITQWMIFSNNQPYDDNQPTPVQGAFYATPAHSEPVFNYFREEHPLNLAKILHTISDEQENFVLKDHNLPSIKHNDEFTTNKSPHTPTNAICTSLLNKKRLAFLLRYGLTYVKTAHRTQKHIMRYPQLFATLAIRQTLDNGEKKGIIWHTQGSGKTALAYYNVRHLTQYFAEQGIVPKFYFIVDRLDLLQQAQREFTARNLHVHTVQSKQAFIKTIQSNQSVHNHTGQSEITVVNIQKFQDDPNATQAQDYDLNIQRIYFLDEVHRSYNPKGSFLANLTQSDPNAIHIGLTGTPLIGNSDSQHSSRQLFGDYIHKYYYNQSIADGYTLRLIREAIDGQYQEQLNQTLAQTQIQKGSIDRQAILAHPKFIQPLAEYIVNDFEKFRKIHNDNSLGAMVICDSSEQAKALFEHFQSQYATTDRQSDPQKLSRAALILHDIGSKEDRKQQIEDFKDGKIDLLLVYNMLLTGFDAPRLKKLYLGRVIKAHNLLQALTRINRTYEHYRYGYVVDFADIQKEFDKTNKAYWDELTSELGDDIQAYSHMFKSEQEIAQDIAHIKDVLFDFDTQNAEIFCQQISQIDDKKHILTLKQALQTAKELYNLLRLQGDYHHLDQLDFDKLAILYRETQAQLDKLNLLESLSAGDSNHLLHESLEDIYFQFTKIGEHELKLADDLKDSLKKVRENLAANFDKEDPEFIALREELERIFKNRNLSQVSQNDMVKNISLLDEIYLKIKTLNRQNEQLRHKYQGDAKFARLHKRLINKQPFCGQRQKVLDALMGVKQDTDEKVLNLQQMLDNESYFEKQMQGSILNHFKRQQQFAVSPQDIKSINGLLVKEYLKESGRIV